jgi:hypothetical protein
MIENQTFRNQEVVIDGNEYQRCNFENCTLIYQGGEPPTFTRCTFRGGSISLDGSALNTMRYMSGLYQGGLTRPVGRTLESIRKGNLPLANRPADCPPENTGRNFVQIFAWQGVFVVIALLLAFGYWWGYVYQPLFLTLGDTDDVRPLEEQLPLEAMPALPDTLAVAYDDLKAEQMAQITSYRWLDEGEGVVAIPLDRAIDIVLEEGLPEYGAPAPVDPEATAEATAEVEATGDMTEDEPTPDATEETSSGD